MLSPKELALLALLDNVMMKRTILMSSQGTILRKANRTKYNWLVSIYFDHKLTQLLANLTYDSTVIQDENWKKDFVERLTILSQQSPQGL